MTRRSPCFRRFREIIKLETHQKRRSTCRETSIRKNNIKYEVRSRSPVADDNTV